MKECHKLKEYQIHNFFFTLLVQKSTFYDTILQLMMPLCRLYKQIAWDCKVWYCGGGNSFTRVLQHLQLRHCACSLLPAFSPLYACATMKCGRLHELYACMLSYYSSTPLNDARLSDHRDRQIENRPPENVEILVRSVGGTFFSSCPAAVIYCTQLPSSLTQIVHGMEGQHSRIPCRLSGWVYVRLSRIEFSLVSD